MRFTVLNQLIDTMPERGIPLCDLSVTVKGQEVYRRAAGYADETQTRPVSPSDLYWVFSASKLLTCVAALRLVEKGSLSFEDPVSRYLPEYATLYVQSANRTLRPAKTELTIEHLFTMTGGMNYDLQQVPILSAAAQEGGTLDLVRAIAQIPLDFDPGTHFRYSLCHDVLAAVVEVVSGMRFSEYLSREILLPLGMTHTGFRLSEGERGRLCALYRYDNATASALQIPAENPYILSPNYDSGGAGLFSSVDDYAAFLAALAQNGRSQDGYRLLRPETIALMGKNRLNPSAMRDFFSDRLYGYGWGYCGRAHQNPTISLSKSPVGEFGWDGAAGSYALVDPVHEIGIFFATHVLDCRILYHLLHSALRNLVYESLGL